MGFSWFKHQNWGMNCLIQELGISFTLFVKQMDPNRKCDTEHKLPDNYFFLQNSQPWSLLVPRGSLRLPGKNNASQTSLTIARPHLRPGLEVSRVHVQLTQPSVPKFGPHSQGPTPPLGKFSSFLHASIAFEGMGRPRGFRRLRKTHLENILSRGS